MPPSADIDIAEALRRLRHDIVDMAEHSSHVGSALSCVDLLAVLYSGVLNVSPEAPEAPDRDIFILSKAHGCMALYAVLAWRGFFGRERLAEYCRDGGSLAEHPLAGAVPGVEFATGSMGHGLAVAAGMAGAFKIRGESRRVFVLMGDGECDEGAVWEAAALASARELDNLVALIDCNGLQACDTCANVSPHLSLPASWAAHGWEVEEIDGHDTGGVRGLLSRPVTSGRPTVILCRTVKGKGLGSMEGTILCHYRSLHGREKDDAHGSVDRA